MLKGLSIGRYPLRYEVKNNGGFEEDINNRIKFGWVK